MEPFLKSTVSGLLRYLGALPLLLLLLLLPKEPSSTRPPNPMTAPCAFRMGTMSLSGAE